MIHDLSRRRFLQASAAALVPAFPLPTPRGEQDAKAAEPALTAYQDGPQVWVRLGHRPLTSYRAHPSQKYPYFFPLSGPMTGLSLTTESALPWPHHRSLFFGCDRVNGGNYWQGSVELGQIVSVGPKLGSVTANSAEILDECQWRQPGQEPVIVDRRRFAITVASPQTWFIDARITLIARRLIQVLKTNHSLFAVRAAPALTPSGGGYLVNSEGKVGEQASFGQEAAWCDFSGRRRALGDDVVEGIALLDHPSNPWSPCKWFTRDYGFMSPTPFNWLDEEGWRLAADQQVALRYRVVAHTGDAKDADMAGIFKEWATAQPRAEELHTNPKG